MQISLGETEGPIERCHTQPFVHRIRLAPGPSIQILLQIGIELRLHIRMAQIIPID